MFDKIKKKKSIYELGIIFGVCIMLTASVIYVRSAYRDDSSLILLSILIFLFGIYVCYIFTKRIKKLSNQIKQKYVYEELQKIFPKAVYEYDKGFSQNEVTMSGLLETHTKYHSEDRITGKFKDVLFRCSDVHQQELRSAGKTVILVTVFQGRVYEFYFPKEFLYNLLIIQPGEYRPFSGYKKLKLESIDFNTKLKIYAKDEHEAFYLLTPHFMEKLLYLDKKYDSHIKFSFLNNRLFIAVDNRVDSFDIKPFRELNSSIFKKTRNELLEIKEFIEDLKLNQNLFKK